jgi:hypothetical protein
MKPTEIAGQLGIGRASVYRILGDSDDVGSTSADRETIA